MADRQDNADMREAVLHRLASFALALCLAVLGLTSVLLAVPSFRTHFGFSIGEAPGYTVGDGIDVPVELYGDADHTLLIFARSSCAVCQSAKQSIGEVLAAIPKTQRVQVRMVAVGNGQTIAAEEQYAREIGLAESDLEFLTGPLRLKGVPTIALVNRDGKVMAVQEGAFIAEAQGAFVQAVTNQVTHSAR